MRLERDIVIDRPAADVFAFVSEPRNLPAWQHSVVEVSRDDGPVEVGTRFAEVRHFLGKRFASTVEVIELEPHRSFAVRIVDGSVPATIYHLLETLGEKTRLTVVGEAKPTGLLRFAAGAMAKAAEHEGQADLARLKTLLEGSG
jgi:carbon monoxide dehydrogenase subunit G